MSEKLNETKKIVIDILASKAFHDAIGSYIKSKGPQTFKSTTKVGRPKKKKVGRPRIHPITETRPVGRPKKLSVEVLSKKRRGRPRKYDVDLLKPELELVNPLVSFLKSSKKPVNTQRLVYHLSSVAKQDIAETTLRKVINYVRAKSIAPIVCSKTNGYLISSKKSLIKAQIDSLNKRASAIVSSANGLKAFL